MAHILNKKHKNQKNKTKKPKTPKFRCDMFTVWGGCCNGFQNGDLMAIPFTLEFIHCLVMGFLAYKSFWFLITFSIKHQILNMEFKESCKLILLYIFRLIPCHKTYSPYYLGHLWPCSAK